MGGGGGGALDSLQNLIDQVVRPVAETTLTGGLNLTEEGKKIKKAGDQFLYSASGQMAKDVADEEKRQAGVEQGKREAAIAEQETKNENQKKTNQLRARQRSASGQGRSSTILTSSLGAPASGQAAGGKTLLGS